MSMTKPSWRKRSTGEPNPYSSREYRRLRDMIRKRDPMCIRCFTLHQIIVAGEELDHFINLASGGEHDPNTVWMLCRSCHAEKTQNESNGRSGFHDVIDAATGWPIEQPDWLSIIRKRQDEYNRKTGF